MYQTLVEICYPLCVCFLWIWLVFYLSQRCSNQQVI